MGTRGGTCWFILLNGGCQVTRTERKPQTAGQANPIFAFSRDAMLPVSTPPQPLHDPNSKDQLLAIRVPMSTMLSQTDDRCRSEERCKEPISEERRKKKI
ncbi:hypothetical protein VTK26DRAFT_171 [Humicola hyalothermophila]